MALQPSSRSSRVGLRQIVVAVHPPRPTPPGTKDDRHAKLAARLRYAPPAIQLGRETVNALTFEVDQSPGASHCRSPSAQPGAVCRRLRRHAPPLGADGAGSVRSAARRSGRRHPAGTPLQDRRRGPQLYRLPRARHRRAGARLARSRRDNGRAAVPLGRQSRNVSSSIRAPASDTWPGRSNPRCSPDSRSRRSSSRDRVRPPSDEIRPPANSAVTLFLLTAGKSSWGRVSSVMVEVGCRCLRKNEFGTIFYLVSTAYSMTTTTSSRRAE